VRQLVRARLRAGHWKRRTCKSCSYFAFARGEVASKRQLRKRRDLKQKMCRRCPARVWLTVLKDEVR
jgi:hypothetical protein